MTANKPLYMSFVDLEKAFDRVLVGNVQAWNRQVAGGLGPVYVHGHEKQSKNWRWIQQGVCCWSRCSPGLGPQPTSQRFYLGSSVHAPHGNCCMQVT